MADPNDLFSQAVEAARSGDKATALRVLSELVRQSPRESRAWYLLSQLVDQPERARFCLQKVLEIDPNNAKARQRLEALQNGTWTPGAVSPPPQPAPPRAAPTQAAAPANPPPNKPILPPWLSNTDANLPLSPLPDLPPAPEEIPSYPSTYVPPSIPGLIESPASEPKIDPKFAPKAPPKTPKQKKDFFGVIVIIATIGAALCICLCGAFYYAGDRMTGAVTGGGQMPVPAASSYKVTYRVSGTGEAQVIYLNGQGQQIDKKVYLPWWASMEMPANSFPTVTARLLDSQQRLTCSIELNDKPWKQQTSDKIVSCFGILAGP